MISASQVVETLINTDDFDTTEFYIHCVNVILYSCSEKFNMLNVFAGICGDSLSSI